MRTLVVLLALLCAFGWSAAPAQQERREEVLADALERVISRHVPQFKDHYFSFVIGIDSSASFASSNLTFTRLAVNEFLRRNLVPGESVAVYHFGVNAHPLFGGHFRGVPSTVLGARAEIQSINGDILKLVQQNEERGTDVNHALLYALQTAGRAPRRNRLMLLFTDAYGEIAQWSKKPANMKKLGRAVKAFGRDDRSDRLAEGVYVRYTWQVGDETLMEPAKYGVEPRGADLRHEVAAVVNPRSAPGRSSPRVATEEPDADSLVLWPPASPRALGAVVILVLAVGGVAGYFLTRPIAVTLARDIESTAHVPLNRSYDIGGRHERPDAGFETASLAEPIARIRHSFPRQLTVARLKAAVSCRIVLPDGVHVEQEPELLSDTADIYWTDPQTGRFCSVHVHRGQQRDEAPSSTPGGDAAGPRPRG